jgi:hypothetical protein
MRARKLIGLAVLLVALAMVVNALAYSKATVKNTTSFNIDTTGSATLAIDKSPAVTTPTPGLSVDDADGYLKISISDTIQPNATYMYGPVFKIVNNDTVKAVTISDPTITLTGGATVGFTTDAAGASPYTGSTLQKKGTAGQDSVTLYLKLDVPAGYKTALGTYGNFTPTLTIVGTPN